VGNNGAGNTAVGAEGGKWMKEAGWRTPNSLSACVCVFFFFLIFFFFK
jgi:hypothetical protein